MFKDFWRSYTESQAEREREGGSVFFNIFIEEQWSAKRVGLKGERSWPSVLGRRYLDRVLGAEIFAAV